MVTDKNSCSYILILTVNYVLSNNIHYLGFRFPNCIFAKNCE